MFATVSSAGDNNRGGGPISGISQPILPTATFKCFCLSRKMDFSSFILRKKIFYYCLHSYFMPPFGNLCIVRNKIITSFSWRRAFFFFVLRKGVFMISIWNKLFCTCFPPPISRIRIPCI